MNILEWCKSNQVLCVAIVAVLIVVFIFLFQKYKSSNEHMEQRGFPQTGKVINDSIIYDLGDRATDRQGLTIRDYNIEQGMLDHEFTGMSVSQSTYMPNPFSSSS